MSSLAQNGSRTICVNLPFTHWEDTELDSRRASPSCGTHRDLHRFCMRRQAVADTSKPSTKRLPNDNGPARCKISSQRSACSISFFMPQQIFFFFPCYVPLFFFSAANFLVGSHQQKKGEGGGGEEDFVCMRAWEERSGVFSKKKGTFSSPICHKKKGRLLFQGGVCEHAALLKNAAQRTLFHHISHMEKIHNHVVFHRGTSGEGEAPVVPHYAPSLGRAHTQQFFSTIRHHGRRVRGLASPFRKPKGEEKA